MAVEEVDKTQARHIVADQGRYPVGHFFGDSTGKHQLNVRVVLTNSLCLNHLEVTALPGNLPEGQDPWQKTG